MIGSKTNSFYTFEQMVTTLQLKMLAGLFLLLLTSTNGFAQEMPSREENIDYLVTFGKEAPTGWGDDDHTQIFFFVVPKTHENPVYIRVFDPDVGGKNDQANQGFNSKTRFAVYGGTDAFSDKDARGLQPTGNYKSGSLLASQTFGVQPSVDNNWYTFGPFNPVEGEYVEFLDGYVFKMITEGLSGDDGNLYRYFLSEEGERNVAPEGGNGFTYEYSFRLNSQKGSVAQIYPFVDGNVVSIRQNNFDFDNDGSIRLYSVAKNGHRMVASADGNWGKSDHMVVDAEKGKSLNIQIVKGGTFDNDMVYYVTNQYEEPLPFFAIPIGGSPKYKYDIEIKIDIDTDTH